jgi:hypothetical protein
MSKENLDEFLGRDEQSPLDTDKIYGGNANALDTITTEEVVVTRKVKTVTE